MTTCYVYLIELPGHPETITKIGIAIDPKERLSTLQTANPYPLYLSYAYACESVEDAAAREATLHSRFRDLRMSGEWFACPAEHIVRNARDLLCEGMTDVTVRVATATPPEDDEPRTLYSPQIFHQYVAVMFVLWCAYGLLALTGWNPAASLVENSVIIQRWVAQGVALFGVIFMTHYGATYDDVPQAIGVSHTTVRRFVQRLDAER